MKSLLSRRRLLAGIILLSFCFGVYEILARRAVSLPEQLRDIRRDVLSDGALSQIAEDYLRRQYLAERFRADPAGVIEDLQKPGPPSEAGDRIYTVAEASLAQALRFEATDPRNAADWYLFAAAKAYDALFAPDCRICSPFDSRHERMRVFYARAVAGWVINRRKLGRFETEDRVILGETYHLEVKHGPNLVDPNAYSELQVALETNVKELSIRSIRHGLGAPFVGWRENRQETKQDRYFPSAGLAQALSAVALFSQPRGDRREAELALYESLSQETIQINGAEIPLVADFTAAFAYQISQAQLRKFNLAHTLDIEAGLGAAGFYMLEPYDPEKIPLITVHGLFSSPLSWIDVTNDLLGDSEIRKNFQLWHFYYPPGLPILISASMFREKIDELFSTFDPEHRNPKMDDAIVLAHSMGGLLTRTAVSDSGDAGWLELFGKREHELPLPPEVDTQLDRLLNFKRKEFIKRVIFVAVPHRGSQMSEDLIGRIGRSLVSLPAKLIANIKELHERLLNFLKPEDLEELVSPEELNSIRGLSPHSRTIQVLSQIAISHEVPFHSIIGTEKKTESGEPFDGVVAYSSAHLDGAASELTVPAGHSAHTHPLAILEIERILRLHLHEFQAKHPSSAETRAPAP